MNLNELLSDGEYKEQYRLDMINWGEEMRAKDYGCFCKIATENGELINNLFLVSTWQYYLNCKRVSFKYNDYKMSCWIIKWIVCSYTIYRQVLVWYKNLASTLNQLLSQIFSWKIAFKIFLPTYTLHTVENHRINI